MNTLTTSLGALALLTTLAGTAVAGPSHPAASFANAASLAKAQTHVAKEGGCPMIKAETKRTASANPKVRNSTRKVTGYRHEGCVGDTAASLACGATGPSCAAMRQS